MNKYKRIFQSLLSMILLLAFFLTAPAPVAYGAKEVKVGYIDYVGFIEVENGQFQGYGVEYLQEIERNSSLHFVYIHDNWNNCLQKLLTGEIDMLCTAQITEGRKKLYAFSKQPVGVEATLIYARRDEDFAFEEFQAFNGKRLGMLKGSFQNEIFPAFAQKHNFQCTPVYYDNETEMAAALIEEKVDLILGGSLAKHPNLNVVSKFGSDPFYFMVNKNNVELLETLDTAMEDIQVKKPYFAMELNDKWYGKNVGAHKPPLTREEINYIKTAPELVVGMRAGLPPLLYTRKEDNKIAGIIPDILDLISKKSGLRFKYKIFTDRSWPVEEVLKKNVDLAVGATRTDILANNRKLVLSNPYLVSDLVAVVLKGRDVYSLPKTDVGFLMDIRSVERMLALKFSDGDPTVFISLQEGANALLNGAVDIFVINRFLADRMLQSIRYNSLTITPDISMTDNQCIIGNQEAINPNLISILNKTIDTISDRELNKIIVANTVADPYKSTIQDLVYFYRYPVFAVFLLLLFCMLMFFYSNMVRSNALKRITASNNHLKEVAKIATNANAAKGQFLSSMSHDIRTPINAIMGLTNLAQEEFGSKNEGIKEYLDKISIASKTLLGIVNNVLDMSAIENNKMEITKERFDLRNLVENIVVVYEGECARRKIKINTDFAGITEPLLYGDATKLSRILSNIFSNAYKFTEANGSISFTAQESIHDDKHMLLAFTIADTGCGMSPDMQKRLFKPFEQERDSRLMKNGGTGLGMAITKNLVTLLQGNISFNSKTNEGTTFKVNVLMERIPNQNIVHQAVQHKDQFYDFGGKRLLLAEDNDINAEIAMRLLAKVNLQIEHAKDGQIALDMFKQHQNTDYYAGILMDIQMPNLNGLETARAIRKLEKAGEHIPIMAMTANAFAEDVAATSAAGMDAHIAKPIDKEVMYSTIAKYV